VDLGDIPFCGDTGHTAYVSLRVEGHLREVTASISGYDLASPGSIGDAELRGNRLTGFHARRLGR